MRRSLYSGARLLQLCVSAGSVGRRQLPSGDRSGARWAARRGGRRMRMHRTEDGQKAFAMFQKLKDEAAQRLHERLQEKTGAGPGCSDAKLNLRTHVGTLLAGTGVQFLHVHFSCAYFSSSCSYKRCPGSTLRVRSSATPESRLRPSRSSNPLNNCKSRSARNPLYSSPHPNHPISPSASTSPAPTSKSTASAHQSPTLPHGCYPINLRPRSETRSSRSSSTQSRASASRFSGSPWVPATFRLPTTATTTCLLGNPILNSSTSPSIVIANTLFPYFAKHSL